MVSRPSDLSASSGEAELALSAINLGDAPAGGSAEPIVLVDALPPGATALHASAVTGTPADGAAPVECNIPAQGAVSCVYEGSLAPYDQIELRITVDLQPGEAWKTGQNLFTVSGGGAPPAALERKLAPAGEAGRLGIEEFQLRPEEEGGALGTQAGSHPFQVTAAVTLTQTSQSMPTALPKELRLRLPAGPVAAAGSVPECPIARFHEDACPLASVVGVGTFTVNEPAQFGVATFPGPIFNLEPSPGEPARFGSLSLGVPIIIDSTIRADDYSAELSIGNISEAAGFLNATVTLWGVPQDARHDSARGTSCLYAARGIPGYACQALQAPDPTVMLSMPTFCDGPSLYSLAEVVPWGDRSRSVAAADPFPRMAGCNRLPFRPSAPARATGSAASSPTGFDLRLELPGDGLQNRDGLAESALRRVELTLPEGFTVNPSAASGLESCGSAGFEAETVADDGCPVASRIGGVVIASPIFSRSLTGGVYLGGEAGERFAGALQLYVVARSRELGLLVKLRALLQLDPRSGRITIRAEDLPQLPLSSLHLTFQQGPRALLATPAACGASAIVTKLTPYSDPAATVEGSSPQEISSGAGGGPCPGTARSFDPALVAGTLDNTAGRYSPFYVHLNRGDGEAELAGLSLTLPSGLAANLSGVQTCSPTELAAAATRSGADEAAAPSCPAAARVGRVLVGAGVGPVLSYAPGTLFLAGPDRGAPYSLAAVTSALLGPLDLGTIVRRFPIEVDPRTGRLSIDFPQTQRLPSILQGVPLHLRDLQLYFDRRGFTGNPTSCAPTAIAGLAYANDGQVTPVAQRFQAADCAALPFHPSISLRLSGGLRRSGHPLLQATIRGDAGQARIAAAGFTLPPGELLDFHHVRDLCPRQLSAERCPDGSRLGDARLWSPLLSTPLRGAIYLRQPSHGYPDLLAELRSGGIRIRLHGHTAASRGRLRVRFGGLPDLPLAKAVISLAGGRRGIFVNSESLCGRNRRVDAVLRAQNGKSLRIRPRLDLNRRC
jgi:hypothetical protein